MEKQLTWETEVGGVVYTVTCEKQKTLFDVYVDGELAIKVPRKMKNDDSDSEYDLRIGGKRCQFVVYDGKPDLCVDGILLGAERELQQEEVRNRRRKIICGIMAVLASTYATYLWFVFEAAGNPIFGGVVSLIFIQIFFFGGIWLLLSAVRKNKTEY